MHKWLAVLVILDEMLNKNNNQLVNSNELKKTIIFFNKFWFLYLMKLVHVLYCITETLNGCELQIYTQISH